MNTPVREGETIEGSRTMYHAESTLVSSAQVLKPPRTRTKKPLEPLPGPGAETGVAECAHFFPLEREWRKGSSDSKVWRESAEVVTTVYTSAVLANWRRAELTKRCRAVCHHDANSPNVWGSAALASRIASSSRASAPTAAGSVESYKFMVSFRYVFWSS